MQVNATPIGTFDVNAAIGPYLRVKLTAGVLALAGADDVEVGTTQRRVLVTGLGRVDAAAVVLPNAPGTVKMIAAGAIDQYAEIYGAAGGKMSATPNGNFLGFAMEAATADGDAIEVLRLGNRGRVSTVEAKTADYTVLAAESGKTFTTVGAAGTVVFTLPPAVVGLQYRFRVGAAQALRLDPDGTETIALPSTGVQGAAGKYLGADADGETLAIECTKAGQWSVFGFTGTWTAES